MEAKVDPSERRSRPSAEWSALPDINRLARRLDAPTPTPKRLDVDELLGVAPSSPLAAPTLPATSLDHAQAWGGASLRLVLASAVGLALLALLSLLAPRTAPHPSAPPSAASRASPPPATAPKRGVDVLAIARGSAAASPTTPRVPGKAPPRSTRRPPRTTRCAASAPTLTAALPTLPHRTATEAAFSRATSAIARCGDGSGRRVIVTVTFAHTGRATTARVSGLPPGVMVTCLVAAARRVTLPRFASPLFTVAYPYRLR